MSSVSNNKSNHNNKHKRIYNKINNNDSNNNLSQFEYALIAANKTQWNTLRNSQQITSNLFKIKNNASSYMYYAIFHNPQSKHTTS